MSTKAFKTFWNGGGHGRRTAISPKSLSANAGIRQMHRVIALGTGAVTTATYLVGIMPSTGGKVQSIKFIGQAAVTGTSLTAEVKKLSADGNTATTLQSAATDIKTTASTDGVAQSAALTATTANLTIAANLAVQVVITADTVGAGNGDLVVLIEYVPSEDSKQTDNSIQIVENLL